MDKPDHTSRDHAEFSPSSLKYVAACSGYTGRSGTSAAAEKGTRIHEALEVRDSSALHDEGEVEIYEQIVKDEDEFLQTVIGDTERTEYNEVLVDVELDRTSTWGTCDRLTLYGNKAVMGDYKTGISIIDAPRDNWQAKAYTVGAFQRFPDIQTITFVFYIPVRGEVLHSEFKRKELPELIKELSYVIKSGELIRPKWDEGTPELRDLTPNVNCRFCAYEERCPALGAIAIEIANRVAENTLPECDITDPDDPETLEHLWPIAKIVTNWATRIRAKAIAVARDGKEFPSLRLRSLGATRKCNDNTKLMEIVSDFDLQDEDIVNIANFPLKKIAEAVGRSAPEGEQGQKARDFMDAVEAADIINQSDTRYTLS
jgi:CRISPR/Cas system-associated exonuclease Cas4 (RecB family)